MSAKIKAKRIYAYDKTDPWYFDDLPLDDTTRDCAIFVVHGIGKQRYSETAKTLRDGFETALADIQDFIRNQELEKEQRKYKLQGKNWKEIKPQEPDILPPPYVFEGYWADYGNIKATFPEIWPKFSKFEGIFFNNLARLRITDPQKTAWWFIRQILRTLLPWMSENIPTLNRLAVIALSPLIVFVVLFMLTIKPEVYSDVLSDIKIYCDPQGSFEKAIVQRIDHRVGKRLLALLGLDWDFQNLPQSKQIKICKKPHYFKYVTVMAHSLGSVIAYNVIGDILQRAEDYEKYINNPKTCPLGMELPPPANIQRVRTGLHRFYTMGSPLHLIDLLFHRRICEWPESAKKMFFTQTKGGKTRLRQWWCNFHHIDDPISSPLYKPFIGVKDQPGVINLHSGNIWHIPGGAHSSYFKEKDILRFAISRTYGRTLKGKKNNEWTKLGFLSRGWFNTLRVLVIVLFVIAFIAVIGLAIYWLLGRLYGILKNIVGWLVSFFTD